jgi:hypothetical protein
LRPWVGTRTRVRAWIRCRLGVRVWCGVRSWVGCGVWVGLGIWLRFRWWVRSGWWVGIWRGVRVWWMGVRVWSGIRVGIRIRWMWIWLRGWIWAHFLIFPLHLNQKHPHEYTYAQLQNSKYYIPSGWRARLWLLVHIFIEG